MSVFAKLTPAPQPKTKNVRVISLGLAALFIIIVTVQLFSFEKFADVFRHMWLPFEDLDQVRATVLVTAEVLALPFLLSMPLSQAMRVLSMISGWLAISAWFIISLWVNVSDNVVANSGVLGATIPLPSGWWTVLLWLAMGVLAVWSAWGMWPFTRGARSK